jgi:hypothetical protein
MFKKILIFIILFFSLLNITSAIYISSKIKVIYSKIALKIETKNESIEKQISIFK